MIFSIVQQVFICLHISMLHILMLTHTIENNTKFYKLQINTNYAEKLFIHVTNLYKYVKNELSTRRYF